MILNPLSVIQFVFHPKLKEVSLSHWAIITTVLAGIILEQINANAQANILEYHTMKLGEMTGDIKKLGGDLDHLLALTTTIQVKNADQDKRLDELEKSNKEHEERIKKLEEKEKKDEKDDGKNN